MQSVSPIIHPSMVDDTLAVIFSQGFFAKRFTGVHTYNACTEMSVMMYSASGSCPSHNLCILSRQGRKGFFKVSTCILFTCIFVVLPIVGDYFSPATYYLTHNKTVITD